MLALRPARQKRSEGIVLRFGDCRAAAAFGTVADWNQPVRKGIRRRL